MNNEDQRKWKEAQERARILEQLGRNFAWALVVAEFVMPIGIVISLALGLL